MGPGTVLVTRLVLRPDRPEGTIEMLAVHGDGAWIVQTPNCPMKANGSGDVTAALFTAHLLQTGDAVSPSGAPSPASSTCSPAPTSRDAAKPSAVQSQDAIANPRMQFEVRHPLTDPRRSPQALPAGSRAQSTTRSSRWMTSRSYA